MEIEIDRDKIEIDRDKWLTLKQELVSVLHKYLRSEIVPIENAERLEPLGAGEIRQLKQQIESLQKRVSKLEGGAK